ncbi:hypothetical protein GJ496_000162 [Pomphorhynchus laevis]|nr:hypothetical protein GJ496_000162 [Pomphorhynchus laevis]
MNLEIRDYDADAEIVHNFLTTWSGYDETLHEKSHKYISQMAMLANRSRTCICVSLDDLKSFNAKLTEALLSNTHRYVQLFTKVVQSMLDNELTMLSEYIDSVHPKTKDSLDVYIDNCKQKKQNASKDKTYKDPFNRIPDELLCRFEIYFTPMKDIIPLSVRQVKSEQIGQLLTIKAIVTRSSEVRPMLSVGTYTCLRCGSETYQPISGPTFTPLQGCPAKDCQINQRFGQLIFQTRGSKFSKFQELRIQELSDQVPVGNIPRSLTVWCVGENTRLCQPGDNIMITGVLLPVQRYTRGRIVQRGLLTDLVFFTHHIELTEKGSSNSVLQQDSDAFITDEERDKLKEGSMYEKLATSLAPEIYGHDDLKKALLLLLVGGTGLKSKDIKIRGNINICMMGDPGVAKSQLLSYISRISSRSQYTTGRGSSGVGLTAAVMRDPLTGELILEGGALVLADQGICCIDEFDKMSETDRTSIHEVMEQQTISVAKAGILTTLNARVSIVAAANPIYGRYNPHRTLEQNIQLPPALLSRFDLLWLLQDKPNVDFDLRIAKHIVQVHTDASRITDGQSRISTRTTNISKHLETTDIRRILAICRQIKVTVPKELIQHIISAYVQMREESRNDNCLNNNRQQFTSARTLLSILRLASAHAKLRLSEVMEEIDVEEAVRLTEKSHESLSAFSADSRPIFTRKNPSDQIYMIIRNIAMSTEELQKTQQISYQQALEHSLQQGFTKQQFESAIEDYERLDVITLVKNGTVINLL